MSIVYFNGFETGDASNLVLFDASLQSIVTTTKKSGAYALENRGNRTTFYQFGTASATVSVSAWVDKGDDLGNILELLDGSFQRFRLNYNSSRQVRITNPAGGDFSETSGSTVQPSGLNHIAFSYDGAAGGAIKVWVNGILEIDITHSNSRTISTVGTVAGDATNPIYVDDVVIDNTATQLGRCQIIARQFTAGTPTYTGFTKNGGTNIEDVWNATPFATAANASSSGSLAAQTALTASFSATQSGHGNEILTEFDTILAVKQGMVAKRGTGSGNIPSHRRRVSGGDTDTSTGGLTTSDVYYENIWSATPTLAALNASEVGIVRASGTGQTTTVEDMWVQCCYISGVAPYAEKYQQFLAQ